MKMLFRTITLFLFPLCIMHHVHSVHTVLYYTWYTTKSTSSLQPTHYSHFYCILHTVCTICTLCYITHDILHNVKVYSQHTIPVSIAQYKPYALCIHCAISHMIYYKMYKFFRTNTLFPFLSCIMYRAHYIYVLCYITYDIPQHAHIVYWTHQRHATTCEGIHWSSPCPPAVISTIGKLM